jgi:hypothetical protein
MRIATLRRLVVLAAIGQAPPVLASQMLTLSGHSWETNSFPRSDPGDVFHAVGIVEEIKAPLVWDAAQNAYTWVLRDAVSLGETILGSTHFVTYAGGSIAFHADRIPANHSFGTFPPNDTAPATFADGSTYLRGDFTALTLTYDELTRSGSLAGKVTFAGGDVFPLLDNTHGLAFAATFGGFSPAGYDLRLVGSFFLETVSVRETTWGRIKAQYQ